MQFDWDEEKRRANLAKHGLDFAEARWVFASEIFIVEDRREAYGEQRFVASGMLFGCVVIMVFTYREEGSIRVISMRKANKHEQRSYDQKRFGSTR